MNNVTSHNILASIFEVKYATPESDILLKTEGLHFSKSGDLKDDHDKYDSK